MKHKKMSRADARAKFLVEYCAERCAGCHFDEICSNCEIGIAIEVLSDDWVPVKERLPKADGERDGYRVCLVSTDTDAVFRGHYDTEEKVWYVELPLVKSFMKMSSSIKAWRPLPEPYKEVCDE